MDTHSGFPIYSNRDDQKNVTLCKLCSMRVLYAWTWPVIYMQFNTICIQEYSEQQLRKEKVSLMTVVTAWSWSINQLLKSHEKRWIHGIQWESRIQVSQFQFSCTVKLEGTFVLKSANDNVTIKTLLLWRGWCKGWLS